MRMIRYGMAVLMELATLLLVPVAASDDVGARLSTPLEHLPALAGDYFPLTDRGSGRVHHVYVRYPEGYDATAATRYPVVYLLDGDSLFPLLAPTHLFLHYDEQLPDAIIVGIAYGGFDPAINKRHVDFTAPGSDTTAEQGGAPGFLAFLRGQLVPEVERRYASDPARRVLVGQSRAGYFVLWSALQDPDLFWGRIASNPRRVRSANSCSSRRGRMHATTCAWPSPAARATPPNASASRASGQRTGRGPRRMRRGR